MRNFEIRPYAPLRKQNHENHTGYILFVQKCCPPPPHIIEHTFYHKRFYLLGVKLLFEKNIFRGFLFQLNQSKKTYFQNYPQFCPHQQKKQLNVPKLENFNNEKKMMRYIFDF